MPALSDTSDELSKASARIADLKRLVGQKIFSASLAARRGRTPAERRAWREGVYTVIKAMMASGLQGGIGIERMCRLANVSRAGYYRHWQASSPRREEAGLRDAIQRCPIHITAIAGLPCCLAGRAGGRTISRYDKLAANFQVALAVEPLAEAGLPAPVALRRDAGRHRLCRPARWCAGRDDRAAGQRPVHRASARRSGRV